MERKERGVTNLEMRKTTPGVTGVVMEILNETPKRYQGQDSQSCPKSR